MLNHGLQTNDLQTEFPAYPKVEITIDKTQEPNIIQSLKPKVIYFSLEN